MDNMFYVDKNQKMSWQYKLIKDIILKGYNDDFLISSIYDENINKEIYEIKKKNCPMQLYKFYAPTIENVSDVQRRLLWLASPDTFNDPYDCKLTFDREKFEQYYTIRSFVNSSIFSEEEKCMIYKTNYRRSFNSFDSILDKIINDHKNVKAEEFKHQLRDNSWIVCEYIKDLMDNRYRIACFSSYNWDSKNYEQLMWAHYAKSHQGFCVKYDISPLFDESISDKDLFSIDSTERSIYDYLLSNEKRKILINGFFPVVYSSNRVALAKSLCYNIAKDKCTKKNIHEININALKAIITKLGPWKYEQEWRLIIDAQMSKEVNNKIIFPFAKEIIIGVNASDELKRILHDIAKLLNIKIHQEYL